MRHCLTVIVLVAAFQLPLHGQGADASKTSVSNTPAFEVATVKPHKSGTRNSGICCPWGSEFTAINQPLDRIIAFAFAVRVEQIVNLPGWAHTERFDIVGKYPSGTQRTIAGMDEMLRGVLAERFNLHTHRETQELSVYALALARRDRRLGPFLRPSTNASPFDSTTATIADAHAVPISALITFLSDELDRPLVDRTGLTGTYDYELHWRTDGPMPDRPTATENPWVFTALREQLGLKLESTKAPIDVVVIDHVEKPTPD